MFFVVDLIIVAIILLFTFLGYKRGLVKLAIKLCTFIIAVIVAFGCLAFVGAIAILNFSRLIGISILGESRSDVSKNVSKDVMLVMNIPALVLSLLIFFIGIFPHRLLIQHLRNKTNEYIYQCRYDVFYIYIYFSYGYLVILFKCHC